MVDVKRMGEKKDFGPFGCISSLCPRGNMIERVFFERTSLYSLESECQVLFSSTERVKDVVVELKNDDYVDARCR